MGGGDTAHLRPGAIVGDADRLFAEALGLMLSQRCIHVLGTAASAAVALELVGSREASIAVVGLTLQRELPVPLALALRERRPAVRVVALADAHCTREEVGEGAGFHSALAKDLPLDALAEGVAAVARGQRVFRVAAPPVTSVQASAARRHEELLLDQLTPRELEVLRLLADGTSSDAIARGLGIKPNTARTHVQNILTKLNVNSRLEAVALAIREGLVPASLP